MNVRQPQISLRNWVNDCGDQAHKYADITALIKQLLLPSTLVKYIEILSQIEEEIKRIEPGIELPHFLQALRVEVKEFLQILQPKDNLFSTEKLDMDPEFEGEDKSRKVIYFNDKQREEFRVIYYKDKLLKIEQSKDSIFLTPFTTKIQSRFNTNKDSRHIFVIDPQTQHFFFCESIKGHHSSFLGGKPVLMAGEAIVVEGEITFMNNFSGHYRPDRNHLNLYIGQLNNLNIFSKDVNFWDEQNKLKVTLEEGLSEKKFAPSNEPKSLFGNRFPLTRKVYESEEEKVYKSEEDSNEDQFKASMKQRESVLDKSPILDTKKDSIKDAFKASVKQSFIFSGSLQENKSDDEREESSVDSDDDLFAIMMKENKKLLEKMTTSSQQN